MDYSEVLGARLGHTHTMHRIRTLPSDGELRGDSRASSLILQKELRLGMLRPCVEAWAHPQYRWAQDHRNVLTGWTTGILTRTAASTLHEAPSSGLLREPAPSGHSTSLLQDNLLPAHPPLCPCNSVHLWAPPQSRQMFLHPLPLPWSSPCCWLSHADTYSTSPSQVAGVCYPSPTDFYFVHIASETRQTYYCLFGGHVPSTEVMVISLRQVACLCSPRTWQSVIKSEPSWRCARPLLCTNLCEQALSHLGTKFVHARC